MSGERSDDFLCWVVWHLNMVSIKTTSQNHINDLPSKRGAKRKVILEQRAMY